MNFIKSLAVASFSLLTMVGAQAAETHDVAVCASGFNITLGPGDKATCTKKVTEWVSIGTRKCLVGGHLTSTSDEAADGGDKCTGNGVGSLVSGPAVLCEISYPGQNIRTNINRNARDQCERKETTTVYGNITIRQE